MNTSTNQNWGAVWIDHFKALVVLPKDHDAELSTLYSGLQSKHKSTGGKGKSPPYMHETGPFSKPHFDEKQKNHLHKFYQQVAETVQDVSELLVLGTGRAPKEFTDLFLEEPLHQHVRVTTEKAEDITERELKKKVWEHFGYTIPRSWPDMPGQPSHQF